MLTELDKPRGIILNQEDGLVDEPDMQLGLEQNLYILDQHDIFIEPDILQKDKLGENEKVDENEEVDKDEEVYEEDLI